METGCRSTAFRGGRGVAKFLWQPRHSGTLSTPQPCELLRRITNSSDRPPQGEVLYNDDTTVRILEMMGQRARRAPPPQSDLQTEDYGIALHKIRFVG